MNEEGRVNFYLKLKDLAVYIKNLILYKSKQAGTDRAHIKSFQSILERRIGNIEILKDFFDEDKGIVVQMLRYLEECGEIANMKNGYYMVLLPRNIRLPKSKQIITIGGLSNDYIDIDSFRVMHSNYEETLDVMNLNEYRFDYDLDTWLNIFRQEKEEINLSNCIFQKPTKHGLREVKYTEIKDRELYYCISNPIADKKEYYIAYKVNEGWYGTFINDNIMKARFVLLNNADYKPSYSIKKLKNFNSLYEIKLSNILPDVENDQVLLFSIPETLSGARKYYVAKNYLEDFIYILDELNFRRER